MSANITMLPNPANIPKDTIWGFGQLEYTKEYWRQILWNKALMDSINWDYDSLILADNITLLNFMKTGRNVPVLWLPKPAKCGCSNGLRCKGPSHWQVNTKYRIKPVSKHKSFSEIDGHDLRNGIYAPEITKQKNGSNVIVKEFSNEEEFAMISFIIDIILQVLQKNETKFSQHFHSFQVMDGLRFQLSWTVKGIQLLCINVAITPASKAQINRRTPTEQVKTVESTV